MGVLACVGVNDCALELVIIFYTDTLQPTNDAITANILEYVPYMLVFGAWFLIIAFIPPKYVCTPPRP